MESGSVQGDEELGGDDPWHSSTTVCGGASGDQRDLSDAGNGKLEVSCNPSLTGFTVTIDDGAHDDGTTRRLSNGTQTIPYLYLAMELD